MAGIFLSATVVTRGWNGYRKKCQHVKLTLEKKSVPPLVPRLEPETKKEFFLSRVRRSTNAELFLTGGGGGERERQTDTQTHRHTDRHTDRATDRVTETKQQRTRYEAAHTSIMNTYNGGRRPKSDTRS